MKYKATWGFLIIFLALTAYLLFFDIPKEKKEIEQKEKAEKLFDFSADQVSQVELISLKGRFLFQKNPEGKWMVQNIPQDTASAPLNVLADSREIESIIQKINDLGTTRLIDEKGDDLKSFGFPTPEKSAGVTLKDKSTLKLLIGDEGALSQTLYVKRGDSGKVYLAGADIKSIIEKDFWGLRNKRLIFYDQGLIDQIEVKTLEKSWSLTKKGEEWTFGDRPNDKIDEVRVSSFLFMAGMLEGEKILDEEARRLKDYGLDAPIVSLKFHEKGKTYTILVGNKTGKIKGPADGLSALGNPSGSVFQINKNFLNKIPSKDDLIKKEPSPLPSSSSIMQGSH